MGTVRHCVHEARGTSDTPIGRHESASDASRAPGSRVSHQAADRRSTARDRAIDPRATRQADRPRRLRQRQPVVLAPTPPRRSSASSSPAGLGVAAFSRVVPITIALLLVLGVLLFSYRQTIRAYPQAGGAYLVTRDNFGVKPAQVAGVALLTDYILTVSVSVAAGTAALTSVFEGLHTWRVPISLGFIVILTFGNLRGVRESGRIFATPTYFFLLMMGILLGYVFRPHGHGVPPAAHVAVPAAADGERGRLRPDLPRPQGLRLRRRGRDRRRGDLERRAGVQAAGVEERDHDADVDGVVARRDVPRPLDPGARRCTSSPTPREGHGARADRERRVRGVRDRRCALRRASRRRRC